MMENLIAGINRFQNKVHAPRSAEFEKLADGQEPWALFITCSDSRIDPNLLTQTKPGELFVIRNAGNMVPAFPTPGGGEGGTLEFAVAVLGVPHIIVCGHSDCGAMKAALSPEAAATMPSLKQWIELTRETATEVNARTDLAAQPERLTAVTERNVVAQLDNLRTYPCVTKAIAAGDLELHGWVYDFTNGEVRAYAESTGSFVPLAEAYQGGVRA